MSLHPLEKGILLLHEERGNNEAVIKQARYLQKKHALDMEGNKIRINYDLIWDLVNS